MKMFSRRTFKPVIFSLLLAYSFSSKASAEGIITRLLGDPNERFEQAVADLEHRPENPAYWFEFYSSVLASWERTMLIFGYADNLPVCQRLIELGYSEAPHRDYRCRPAN